MHVVTVDFHVEAQFVAVRAKAIPTFFLVS